MIRKKINPKEYIRDIVDNYIIAAKKLLSKKYKEMFSIESIQLDIGNTEQTLFVHPENNPNLSFTVQISQNGEIIDDYIPRKALTNLEREIENSLLEKSNEAVVRAVAFDIPSNPEDRLLSYCELLERYSCENVLLRIALKNVCISGQEIEHIIQRQIKGFHSNVAAYLYGLNDEMFDKCKELFMKKAHISHDDIIAFFPVNQDTLWFER